MQKKLNKVARDTNTFLKNYLRSQKKTKLIDPIKYGLFPGGKKIRVKILVDIGKILSVPYRHLIRIGAAIECIHAYSLIHDDLPCMDDDDIRRGKLTVHKKYGESTAVLAGNSLLTMAFEIISEKKFPIQDKKKNQLVHILAASSGHTGIAGGQFLDLSFERQRIGKSKILEMQLNKTGKLFMFSTLAPVILSNKKNIFKKFSNLGLEIGLLFQIIDDLLDFKGNAKKLGKKIHKDKKKGKATLISLLGYKNTVKYCNFKKDKIFKVLKNLKKSNDLKDTIEFIVNREK